MATILSNGVYGSSPTPKLKKPKPTAIVAPKIKNPPLAKPKAKTQKAVAPYDPYAPLNPKAIEANARAQAQSQVQPTLDSIASQSRDASGAHDTRQQELTGWYGNFQNTLDESYNDTSSALNNLIALNNAGGTQANQALVAALQGGDQTVGTAASMMGADTPRPSDQDAQILAAAEAASTNDRNSVASNAMGALQGQGERRGLAGIGRIDAGNAEDRRYDATKKELTNQTTDANSQLANLTNSARQTIQQNEATKLGLAQSEQNQQFQQYLSGQELGLKQNDQTFQQWLSKQNLSLDQSKAKDQSAIDWANVGINKSQAEAQIAQYKADAKNATTTAAKQKAELQGKQWASGLQALSSYMATQKGEADPGIEDPKALVDADGNAIKVYRRSYSDALRILTGQVRMSRGDALRLLQASDFPSWRSQATQALKLAHGQLKTAKVKTGATKNFKLKKG